MALASSNFIECRSSSHLALAFRKLACESLAVCSKSASSDSSSDTLASASSCPALWSRVSFCCATSSAENCSSRVTALPFASFSCSPSLVTLEPKSLVRCRSLVMAFSSDSFCAVKELHFSRSENSSVVAVFCCCRRASDFLAISPSAHLSWFCTFVSSVSRRDFWRSSGTTFRSNSSIFSVSLKCCLECSMSWV